MIFVKSIYYLRIEFGYLLRVLLKTFKNFSISNIVYLFNSPLYTFIFCFVIYALFSIYRHGSILNPSYYPYFNYLADSFLHGQFHFRIIPPTSTHDLVFFDNKIFAYWPPFPAILFMPFIAIFGLNFPDILFTIIIGSLSVSLIVILLTELNEKSIISLDKYKQGLLVIFFAFGTAYLTMVPLGRVWFTSLVLGVLLVLLTYLASVKLEGLLGFLVAGITISAAMATRMHLFLAGIWPAWYLISKNWQKPKKQLLGYVVVGLMPLMITNLLMFYYNYARFGNIFDVGLDYHQMALIFIDDYSNYGAFNWFYLPKNFYYQFIAYPFLAKDGMTFFMGGSLFLLSPVYFAVFWAFTDKEKRQSSLFLVLSILLTNIPILLLMGTGWVQFGPRYSLDYSIPLLILTAIGVKNWSNRNTSILVIISMFHYFIGLYSFIITVYP